MANLDFVDAIGSVDGSYLKIKGAWFIFSFHIVLNYQSPTRFSLKYYEDFSLRTGKVFARKFKFLNIFLSFIHSQFNQPGNLKGTTDIAGCEVVPLQHQEKKFCFMINHDERSPMYLQAEDEKMYTCKQVFSLIYIGHS